MSCSPFELKEFLLQELAESQRLQVEAHVQACPSCRMELERLRLTQTALACLRDEEIPQRIGFVSDEVFEPSAWRRGWAAFWGSSARLAFASAAMLSMALLVSPWLRPAPRAASPVTTVSDAEIRQRVDAGVQHAVADIEARYSQRTEQLVKDIRQRDLEERTTIQKAAEMDMNYMRHSLMEAQRTNYQASAHVGEPQ